MIDQPLDDLLARLERERLDADRLYLDALTALDRAVQSSPELPSPPAPLDATRLPDINSHWNILPDSPPIADTSLKSRLRTFVWRLVGPPFEMQKAFNSAVADHLNRNWPSERQSPDTLARLIDVLRREFDALVRFEYALLEYLRTVTVYVDTKDRSLGAGDLKERLSWAEQRILALKREMDGRSGAAAPLAPAPPADSDQAFSAPLDSSPYIGFEDCFRGSQDDVRARGEEYLPLLAACRDVVDVGCGRGELLELLKTHGIAARGVDRNASMVELCRSRGLDAEEGDALSYLERQTDGSLGGLIAIQVVEHFQPAYLIRFLETAHHKMRSGAVLILETINAACWMAFFDAYLRDLTHQRALHPDTLKYLVEASGFGAVDVRFRHPVREADRLARVQVADAEGRSDRIGRLEAVLNAHADTLNSRLFSYTDYAVIARR